MSDKFLKSLIYVLLGCVLIMFLLIQPYNLYCKFFEGCQPILLQELIPGKIGKKEMKINFSSKVSEELLGIVTIKPKAVSEKVFNGSKIKNLYVIKNLTSQIIRTKAIYQINPPEVDKYLDKIQCLCFRSQLIKPGQELEMLVSFRINPKIELDPDLKSIEEVTIGYQIGLVK